MPSRHSKNAGDRHHFTHQERQWTGYGTQKARLGAESQLAFGNCALCLQQTVGKEPMATPSGHMYCKECILQYLLTKTKELKRQRAAYEAQQSELAARAAAAAEETRGQAVDRFVRSQTVGAVGGDGKGSGGGGGGGKGSTALILVGEVEKEEGAAPPAATGSKRPREAEEAALEAARKRAIASIGSMVDATTREENQAKLAKTSFWLPSMAPGHVEETIEAPPARPSSPMSGQPLRAKDLIPIHFTLDSDKAGGGASSGAAAASGKGAAAAAAAVSTHAGRGHIICAVTRREIHHQPTVLLAKSGQVMLKSALEEFALPTMTCPVTGSKFKKGDVVELTRTASSFAASGQVEATKYSHTAF